MTYTTSSSINDDPQQHPCAARLHQATKTTAELSNETTTNGDRQRQQPRCSRISVLTQMRHNYKTNNNINNNILWSLVVYSLLHLSADIILHTTDHNHHQPKQNEAPLSSLSSSNIHGQQQRARCRIVEDGEHLNQIIYQLNNGPTQAADCHSAASLFANPSQNHLQLSSCSSKAKISSPQATTTPSLLTTTTKSATYILTTVFNSFISLLSSATRRSGFIQLAHALPAGAGAGLLDRDQDKDIIVLNSTNFNSELIQHKHPFAHIKLIEYYLPYCSICLKFKTTYAQLAREIRSWRNVIRSAAIDLGVSSNAPIAHSWSIAVVPTLRLHPPLQEKLADKLDQQLAAWSKLSSTSSSTATTVASANELQKSLYEEYTKAQLFISTLGVFKYTIDPSRDRRDSLAEKVSLLKHDLVNYIEQYVNTRKNSYELPATWPNLRPVSESSLKKLRQNHPREELFLFVDQSSTQSNGNNLGLRLMLELSSSSAWKAIRYVRASENRPLIEDVIAEKKLELLATSGDNQNEKIQAINEQIKLLTSSLEPPQGDSENNNNILLIHVENSFGLHPPLTVVTGAVLSTVERSAQLQQQQAQLYQNAARSKRSSSSSASENDLKKKLELIVLYVNQTYSETKEDRAFVEAMRSLDEDPTSFNSIKREAIEKFQDVTATAAAANHFNTSPSSSSLSEINTESTTTTTTTTATVEGKEAVNKNDSTSTTNDATHNTNKLTSFIDSSKSGLNNLFKGLNPFNSSSTTSSIFSSSTSSLHHQDYDNNCQAANYDNRLKSLRYMLFNEIPRVSIQQSVGSSLDKQAKLNTLTNLVAAIRSYFPLPDSASVQFVDGIQNYLARQQSFYSSINLQESSQVGGGFDLLAFKQELKRLEGEGKQLPEIRSWHSRCSLGDGNVPDVWSIFFTLTGFEYKKLQQINHHQLHVKSSSLTSSDTQLTTGATSALAESANELGKQQPGHQQQQLSDTIASPPSGAAPVERLVSPPSTSTSLSLTIATPVSQQQQQQHQTDNNLIGNQVDLPISVLLVVRDYLTHFHSASARAKMFLPETSDLSLDGIRQQPAEFSMLWLWETYNRISKRLSVDGAPTSLNEVGGQQQQQQQPNNSTQLSIDSSRPKNWFPAYEQCKECYRKAPSFIADPAVEPWAIFLDSIEWNRDEILNFLLAEFTWQPMEANNRPTTNIFGYQLPLGLGCLLSLGACCLLLIVLLRLASSYIERQRRHKASLLNGNGAHYSVELQ